MSDVTKDIENLIKSTVPKGAEVKQLYERGDLARVGLLTGESIKSMAVALSDEMNSCIEAHEAIIKMMRSDADATVAEIIRHAEMWRERFLAYGEAARDLQATLRTMADRVLKQAEIAAPPVLNNTTEVVAVGE